MHCLFRARDLRLLPYVIATLALIALVPAAAVAKVSGPDPCAAANLVFPAFAYHNSANGRQLVTIYVTDSTGACSRPIATATTVFVGPRFAYPVGGTSNQGRVVWRDGPTFYGIDFTVTAGNNVSVGTKQAIYGTASAPAGTALDLSKDGLTVYFSTNPADTVLAAASLGTTLQSDPSYTAVYTLDPTRFWERISVSDDGTMIFADVAGQLSNAGNVELARLDVMTQTLNTLQSNALYANYWPAIGPGPTPYLAYVEYVPGLNNCTRLVIADINGNSTGVLSSAHYGTFLSWVAGDVVMQHRNSPDKSGTCADTGTISGVNLADGSETILTAGFAPDGE